MLRTRLLKSSVLLVLPALALLAGCSHLNNPYKDSSAVINDEMTTPSAEGFRGRTEFGRLTRRDAPPSTVYYENGAVSHWPLWWEDPFEDKGNDFDPLQRDAADTVFAWNWVDYSHIGYGPARLVLNTAGWLVSAVVTPPCTLMESNGRLDRNLLDYDHDAKRSDSVTREPPDANIIGKRHLADTSPPEPPETGPEKVSG